MPNAAQKGYTVITYRSVKNVSGSTIAAGAVVRMDLAGKGSSPGLDIDALNAHAIDHFAGITRHALVDDQESHACVQCEGGPILARFKGHASAAAGTWAAPVAGQNYLTYSAFPTGIQLINTMVADTDVHGITEGSATAKVFIYPDALKNVVLLGSPVAADPDGLKDGITIAAEGQTLAAADMLLLGVLDYPRNITLICKTNEADVKAGNYTVLGTDINGDVITEDLVFEDNQSTLEVTLQAFATVTSVTWPAQDGATATWDVGWVDVLGFPFCFVAAVPDIEETRLAGVVEGTVPTVVVDNDEVSKNTIDLNSACNGNGILVKTLYT